MEPVFFFATKKNNTVRVLKAGQISTGFCNCARNWSIYLLSKSSIDTTHFNMPCVSSQSLHWWPEHESMCHPCFLWRLQQYVFGPRWTWEAEINVRRRLKIDKGSKVAVSLAIRASCFLKHSRSPGWRCALHCRELCGEMPSLNLSSPLGKERHQLIVLSQH
jgi:hypothetical protein